ncbi:MAG: hypothetical protein FJX77_02360, partial [Armatimonadetes bacterium]|nr:hypothetical protein [Armatimonadota bacterium]
MRAHVVPSFGFASRSLRAEYSGAPLARRGRRRGQTLILALSILFLMTLLGAAFVTMVLQNLQRVTRQDQGQDALSLALAGIQYAANQFRTSPEGADWRPRATEQLWRTPLPPAIQALPVNPPDTNRQYDLNGDGVLDASEVRQLDPDYEWLSDSGTFRAPFVRIPSGKGRCLLRVTYLPAFDALDATREAAGLRDQFAPNSGMIRIEAIGRPGEFDPNDPTFLRDPALPRQQGSFRKVVAHVPVGLVDQLWWITNHTNERGPAPLGVPAFEMPNRDPAQPAISALTEYPTVYNGSIRSNTSVRFHGRNVLRVHANRGEGLFVKGEISFAPRSNRDPNDPQIAEPELRIDVTSPSFQGSQAATNNPSVPAESHEENPTDDGLIFSRPVPPSSQAGALDSQPYQSMFTAAGSRVRMVFDERHLRNEAESRYRSTRTVDAPQLEQIDPVTGVSRWQQLTRDSGGSVNVTDVTGTVTPINAGWFGLTDQTLPTPIRARGLYLDNFSDIQYPDDRRRVKSEWLQRDPQRTGWFGDYYIPAVRDTTTGQQREIADVLLTRVPDPLRGGLKPVIRIRRFDSDVRQRNLPGGATHDSRMFYSLANVNATATGGTANLVNPTPYRDFDYPENGVFFAEGSIRVRGTVGLPGNPRQLTVVSGGTIYIEGNLLRSDGASALALLAKDYVCLNPTALTRVEPGPDVVVEPHSWDPESGLPNRWHFTIPQDRHMDFLVSSAQPLSTSVLHLEHSAVEGSASSETAVSLFRPVLGPVPTPWPEWTRDRTDFGRSFFGPGPVPSLSYLFHPFGAGVTPGFGESNFLSRQGQPGNFEGKTFVLVGPASGDGVLPPGMEGRYRVLCGPRDDASGQPVPTQDGQPYWLSRAAILPADGPLPIRIQAVMYAFNGSWFVIPPPFFNDRPEDSRANYLRTNRRHFATIPDSGYNTNPNSANAPFMYPYFNEPLNVDIQVEGSITENFPAEPS